MKLFGILFAGTAKATTGVIATVATAATVVTAATVAYSPAPPIQAEPSAPSTYVESLPVQPEALPIEEDLSVKAEIPVEDTQPAMENHTASAADSANISSVAPKAKEDIVVPQTEQPATNVQAENLPAQTQSPSTEEQPDPVKTEIAENAAPPAAKDVNIDRVEKDPTVQPVKDTVSEPQEKPEVKSEPVKDNTAVSAPTPAPAPVPTEPEPVYTPAPQPEPEPEKAPSYQFSYDRTTSIYANDNETLLRVEYYDENNKLTHYSKVEDYDPKTHSYTENIYTYDEETETEILQRTDVYEGDSSESAE